MPRRPVRRTLPDERFPSAPCRAWRAGRGALARSLAIVLGLAAPPAHADLLDEIQVYDDSLNGTGVFATELHLNHSLRGRTAPDYPGAFVSGGATRVTPEFSYGLGSGLEAGLYVNGVVDRQGDAALAGAKLRLKWIARPAPAGGGFFWGVNLEAGRLGYAYDPYRTGIELRPIVGWRDANWVAIVNPILDWAPTARGEDRGAIFAPAAKLGRRLGGSVSVGVELYHDFGAVSRFLPGNAQPNQVFAVIDVDGGPVPFNLGIGRGTGGADRLVVKAILELPF